MRRTIAVLSLGLAVFCSAVRADDKPKLDLKKRLPPQKGDKMVCESEWVSKKTTVYTIDEKPTARIIDESNAYSAVREALVVMGDTVKNEKIKFEKWKNVVDKKEDTSLVGKTVVVPGEGDSPDFTIEGEEKASAEKGDDITAVAPTSKDARAWVKEFLKGGLRPEIDSLVPGEAVSEGAEWKGDTKAVAAAFFPAEWEFDHDKSSVKVKLASVAAAAGIRTAHLEFKIELQLKKVAGRNEALKDEPENGLIKIGGTADFSLDPEKKRAFSIAFDEEVDMSFDMKDAKGKPVGIEMKVKQTVKASETKS